MNENAKSNTDSITQDEENHICKNLSPAAFAEECLRLSYRQLCQINAELSLRAANMIAQIRQRGSTDAEWRRKVDSAIALTDKKILIITSRLNFIRSNSLDSISRSPGRRLTLIKHLVSLIDHHYGATGLSEAEISILDLCRSITSLTDEPKFRGFNFDPVRNTITASDGSDVAVMRFDGVYAEEAGYTLARSIDMGMFLDRWKEFIKVVAESNDCERNEFCLHCRAIEMRKEMLDILSEIK